MRHSRLIINPRHGTRRSFTPPSTISPSTAAAAGMTGSLTPVLPHIWRTIPDLLTRRVILRCDSPDDLYPLVSGPQALLAEISDLWHQRLGHPGHAALSKTLSSFKFSCNKAMSTTCHACRLGKHVRLPFKQSDSQASFPFALMHCDVWTSPIKSVSG
uniref:GAG-pre-integrase domain-containing protein n=1 Tax=Aegilops tauschii subsp. strangulata TaxID=200361 RepID=A0A453EBS9_AEGTS